MAFSLVTPLVLLVLLYAPINLLVINVTMFAMGFTYNARSTGAYLYNTEFIETHKRMNVGICLWTFSGTLQVLTALWFWRTKDQVSYFYLLIISMSVAILIVYFLVPESPLFLYEKNDFERL